MLDRLGIDPRVPRRPAGDHPRGDGRRPDGAHRPGRARARRPDQPARPARRRPVRRGRRPVHRRAHATRVVDGEEVDLGLVGDVVDGRPEAVLDLLDAGRIPVVSTRRARPRRRRPGPQRQRRHRGRRPRRRARRRRSSSCSPTSRASTRDWPDRDSLLSRDQRPSAERAAAQPRRAAWSRRWRPASAPSRAACRRRHVVDGRGAALGAARGLHRRGHRHHGAARTSETERLQR